MTNNVHTMPADLAVRAARVGCSVEELWLRYMAIAGDCSLLEFDAAIHEALALPAFEWQVLEQTLWELEEFE
jgi:hypothetical protein